MRPALQLAFAAALVAASAGIAAAVDNTAAALDLADKAYLTHQFQGQGVRGKMKFEITAGISSFGIPDWNLGIDYARTKPEPPSPVIGSGSFDLPRTRATQKRYWFGADTNKIADESARWTVIGNHAPVIFRQLLAESPQTDSRTFKGIRYNIAVDRVYGGGSGRVYNDFSTYDLDAKIRYKAHFMDDMSRERRFSGLIIIVVRRAPRAAM